MSVDVELFLEEKRWEREIAAASPVVRAWCERFLNGAILSARPPIYGKEQAAILHELALWNTEALLAAAQILSRAILEGRNLPALEEQIGEIAPILTGDTGNQRALHAPSLPVFRWWT